MDLNGEAHKMNINKSRSHTRRKIAAIAAGALVVGIGATYTLASWTDSEWVWGGATGDAPGVGTETFNVQQNASSPFTAGTFDDFEANPGDALTFSTGALSLTPGDTIYAPVALRTEADSLAGTVQLKGAVPAYQPGTTTPVVVQDANGDLWRNIQVTVYTATGTTPPSACGPSFDSTGWDTIVAKAALGTNASATQSLQANAASTQHYCFALTLNTTLATGSSASNINELQDRTIAPAWEFYSESVTTP